jgi:CBS domain-containing protein
VFVAVALKAGGTFFEARSDIGQYRVNGVCLDRAEFMEDHALYTFLEQVVADHMTREAKTVSRDVTLRELEDLFEKDGFNAYPVEENSRVIGLVSKFDFLTCFVFKPANMLPRYDDLMNKAVAAIMTPDFIYVRRETRLTRVLQLMVDHRIRSMPVIEGDQQLVGMISREDVMRALQHCSGRA